MSSRFAFLYRNRCRLIVAFLWSLVALLNVGAAAPINPPVLKKIATLPISVTAAGPLLFAKDGTIYGTSMTGGSHNEGFLYAVTPEGTAKILLQFHFQTCGAYPTGTLVEGPDGVIYGTTYFGGAGQCGTIYGVTPGGQYKMVCDLPSGFPKHPISGLFTLPSKPGVLLGIADMGGLVGYSNSGVLFQITTGGSLEITGKIPFGVFCSIPSSKSETLYGITGREFFQYDLGYESKRLVNLQEHREPENNPQNIVQNKIQDYRQNLVQASDGTIFLTTSSGGKYGEGELLALLQGKKLVSLRPINSQGALGSRIGWLTLGPDDQLFGIMGDTFNQNLSDPTLTKVILPRGVVCNVDRKGEVKIVWSLKNGGPTQALSWHNGALYGVDQNAVSCLRISDDDPPISRATPSTEIPSPTAPNPEYRKFAEDICLSRDAGNELRCKRWTDSPSYSVSGASPEQQELFDCAVKLINKTLASSKYQLRQLPVKGSDANIKVHFVPAKDFRKVVSNYGFTPARTELLFWYAWSGEKDQITKAVVVINTDYGSRVNIEHRVLRGLLGAMGFGGYVEKSPESIFAWRLNLFKLSDADQWLLPFYYTQIEAGFQSKDLRRAFDAQGQPGQ